MAKKILVIDDDPTSNSLVSFLLKANEFDVFVAADGEEGLRRTQTEKPDLVVLDIMMPKMDGYSFLRELKKTNWQKMPLVIMLTSKDSMQDLFKLEGVSDYFIKPLDTTKFLRRIKELLVSKEDSAGSS